MKAFVKILIVLIALGIVGVFGWMWYQQNASELPEDQEVVLVDWVDRGIKPEDLARQQEKIAEVQAQIAEAEAAGERDISLILRLGNLYYSIGELKLSAEQYLDILSTHPGDAPALENLGQVQLERGDYAGAEASWRAALQVSAYEITYIRLADLLTEHFPERQAEARTILEEAIANLGQSVGLLTRLGEWYADNEMYDEAISHYEVALQLDPGNEAIQREIDELKALRLEAAQ